MLGCVWLVYFGDLLSEYPIDKLPDLLVTQARLWPHHKPVAPVSRTASSDYCRQPVGLLRIESIALRYRAERRPNRGLAKRMAVEASLLLRQSVATVEVLSSACRGNRGSEGGNQSIDVGSHGFIPLSVDDIF